MREGLISGIENASQDQPFTRTTTLAVVISVAAAGLGEAFQGSRWTKLAEFEAFYSLKIMVIRLSRYKLDNYTNITHLK